MYCHATTHLYYVCIPKLGQIIWECNVYDTIIPEKCKLFAKTRLEVKLRKKNPGDWEKFLDPTVQYVCLYMCVMYVHAWIVDNIVQ